MATTSDYLKYLPAVLWQNDPPPNLFSLGTMLCPFEKLLTGINDGIAITHGDNSVMTLVTQSVKGSPLSQTVNITPGTGSKFLAGSSYAYSGATPEVVNVAAVNANTLTAVIRQDHAANQTIVNSSGTHQPVQDVIATLVKLYGPWTTPTEFLDWLAQWVALQLDPAWDEYQRRSVIARIVSMYAQRGTKPGLYEFLDIYALARRRPRLVIDDDAKLLFAKPQPGAFAAIPALVSQTPLVAPQCMSRDDTGYVLIGDLGTNDGTIEPALWRLSIGGAYDYAAGKGAVPPAVPVAPSPQPFQPASLHLSAPVCVAVDSPNACAYVIDLTIQYVLYRLADAQVGTVTLSGTPTTGESGVIAVDGTPYTLAQTTGNTLTQQATAWAATLNATSPFDTAYLATATGGAIVITTLSGPPGNDLTLVVSSTHLNLTATGPCYSSFTAFSAPPTGLVFPVAMCVDASGHPLVLDRGALVTHASKTAIVDVQVSGGIYSGTVSHAFAQIVEPLSMTLRTSGTILVGDASYQGSAIPATLWEIDPSTWSITDLLGAVPQANNPLVAPTGVVEVDAHHLLVLDAGLRPYRPDPGSPFTVIVAQQPAIYAVDLSVSPPTITLASDQRALVYPRDMVGESDGTLYICDSGLPDLAGYDSQKWRSLPQQFSVVTHFQGNPAAPVFSVTLSGTPTTGESGVVTIGGVAYTLAETTGNTPAQQAAAWVTALNATASFSAGYVAGSVGDILNVYSVPGSSANGVSFGVTSSVDLLLSAGLLAATVTLSGTPTTGEHGIINIGAIPYTLSETTG
ncbi:MAG TPA: phage tail protein, partial [Candidatus Cybelea sp.]